MYLFFFWPDKSCPGGNPPCSGNGQCNHTTGLCTCNQGNQGTDCSGNTWLTFIFFCFLLYLTCIYLFSELSCPADCSNAGDCDTSTGQCLCDIGRHGADCSSKRNTILLKWDYYSTTKRFKDLFFPMLTVFDCPGDGTCSGQGTCDGTTGTCVCFEGFERASDTCKGTYWLCLGKSW